MHRRALPVILITAGLIGLYATDLRGEVMVDKMFSDHMVLQRDMAVPVWGKADPNEIVSVSFRNQSQTTTADKNGKWMVKLDPLKLGEAAVRKSKGTQLIN